VNHDDQSTNPSPESAEELPLGLRRRTFLRLSLLAAATAACQMPSQAASAAPEPVRSPDRARGEITLGEAIASAFQDAGVRVATNVPATGVVQVFDQLCRRMGTAPSHSYNEEVAYTIAFSAALCGVRSSALLKSHGFAKASNSVVDSLTCGVRAGFVVLVVNDEDGHTSDNIFDLPGFVKGTRIPFRRPAPGEMYAQILEAFEISERFQLPVAVLVDLNDLDRAVHIQRSVCAPPPVPPLARDGRHVMEPMMTVSRDRILQAKLRQEDWRSVSMPPMPVVPDALPPRWQSLARAYLPFFSTFRDLKGPETFVTGDTTVGSMFAFPPFQCIDVVTYYGGSIPLAIGAVLAGRKDVWAVSGDYGFVAAGCLGLAEAVARGIALRLVILHNGHACTTGGQPIAPGLLERLLKGYENCLTRIPDPADPERIKAALSIARKDELRIFLVEYPGCQAI
jgi:TPP-dependent indolepyruvate ferredoxin oxidoreductase alpha subunit